MGFLTEMWVVFGAKTDKLKQGTREAEGVLSGFGQQVNKIGGMIAGAFAVERIASFAWEATKLAGELQGVKFAFDALNKPALLSELRAATQGTVSDLDLMKSAVQANNFKIPLEQLGSLLEFAHLRAQQTGQSVDYLVQSIVLGIGRKSPLILDNLGISTIALKEKFGAAGVEAASVGDIARAVGEIATEAMAKSGKAIETTQGKIERMKAAWVNFKTVIGTTTAPFLEKGIDKLTSLLNKWGMFLNKEGARESLMTSLVGNTQDSLLGLTRADAVKKIFSDIAKYQKEIDKLQKELKTAKYTELFGLKIGRTDKEADILTNNETRIQAYKDAIESLTNTVYDSNQIERLTNAIESEGDAAVLTAEQLAEQAAAAKKLREEQEKLAQQERARFADLVARGLIKTPGLSRSEVNSRIGSNSLTNPEQSKIQALTPDGPQLEEFNQTMDDIDARWEQSANHANNMAQMIVGAFSNVTDMKSFANAVKDAARQVIMAVISETVALNVAKAVREGKTWYGAVIQGALAASATSALFAAIPSFAQGGMVKGPTLAMVGDNPSGREMMVPIPWNGMQAQRQEMQRVEFVLRGQDLYGSTEKYKRHLNNV